MSGGPIAPVFKDDALRARIGRLFVVGIPGTGLDGTTRQTLQALRPGGVILFRRNVGTVDDLRELTRALHTLPSCPLVCLDHEGGRVLRVGEPFTHFPPAADIGRTARAEVAYRVGRAMATELASVGIDLNFAPVLDVDSNPANPVIGDRSFGADPVQVAAMGVALMRGLLDGGVLPCGKHFPGHGDTETDSHLELPVVRRSRAELEATELVPFRAAIASGIPVLMTAHVVYPALDPDVPATISRTVLHQLLRTELGFGGVIASDDLEMRAITDGRPIGDAAVASLRAGADLLLVCQDLTRAAAAVEAVEAAVQRGDLPANAVADALARVDRLRSLRRMREMTTCELPNAAHRQLLEEIAQS
jgi:beta-N-acetylhexosaminidase